MAERYGGDFINNQLVNDSAVTALVGTAIYEDTKVPKSEETFETINYYRPGTFGGGTNWFEIRWSINCRSETYSGSLNIATAVFNLLNRETVTYNSKYYFAVADILPTTEPVDETDVYNTPVEVYIRRK